MARPAPKPEPADDAAPSPHGPLVVLRRCAMRLLPPAASLRIAAHVVPLLVFLSLVPLVLLLSLLSGWYVWKNIPVAWQVPLYLQYGDGLSPYAELSLPPLSTAQPYDLSLHLVLPASEANFALGNFMTTLSLSTPFNKTLVTVSRPSIALPPKRAMFSLSAIPQLIDLNIPLLSSYVPGSSNLHARIDLGRKDGWKSVGNGEGRELSVWNAALKGALRLHGIRGLFSRFPLAFALVASTTFFSLSVTILAACILPAVQWRVSTEETPNVSEPREDRPVRVRKRLRRNVPSESRTPSAAPKAEDSPVDVFPGVPSDDFPLKRRRSRVSDVFLDSEN